MTLEVHPVLGLPEVREGDDLAGLVEAAIRACGLRLVEGDVVVVSSKVVSKAGGLVTAADDRQAVIAAQTRRVVAERSTPGPDPGSAGPLTQVVEAMAGPVMAAAGVDASNTGPAEVLLVLPVPPTDADAICRQLRARWCAAYGLSSLGVVVSDTAGRPWRSGQVDFALGSAGIEVLEDLSGVADADGRVLAVTARALADEIAAAADLVKGKVANVPVAVLRGLDVAFARTADNGDSGPAGARLLVRVGPGDWFAYGWAEAVRAALGVEPGTPLAHRVGVASTAPESLRVRVSRAVAVALHDQESVGVDVSDTQVVVTGPDPVLRGVAAGRICVALFGEGVQGRLTSGGPEPESAVVITLTDAR